MSALPAHRELARPAAGIRRLLLLEGASAGLEVIELDNGQLKLWLLPQRGLGIWKIWYQGMALGWQSPVRGPVHPALVPLAEPGGWLYGFDELLCRCGLESNGPPDRGDDGTIYPLHGRAANLPAHNLTLQHSAAGLGVSGDLYESRLHGQKLALHSQLQLPADGCRIHIRDSVANLSALPASAQLLYHLNIGAPFLQAGCRIHAAVAELAPRDARAADGIAHWADISAPEAGFTEQVYYLRLLPDADGMGEVLLLQPDGECALQLRIRLATLPYFIIWKNLVAAEDGYVLGLEPASNFPNPRRFESARQRVLTLPAKASCELDWQFGLLRGRDLIARELAGLAERQQAQPLQLHHQPRTDWSPTAGFM